MSFEVNFSNSFFSSHAAPTETTTETSVSSSSSSAQPRIKRKRLSEQDPEPDAKRRKVYTMEEMEQTFHPCLDETSFTRVLQAVCRLIQEEKKEYFESAQLTLTRTALHLLSHGAAQELNEYFDQAEKLIQIENQDLKKPVQMLKRKHLRSVRLARHPRSLCFP
jgi:hypothetical protein